MPAQSCFGGIPPSFSPCRALQKPKQRTGIYTPKSLVYADRTPFFNHDFFASHQVVLDVEYIKTQARYCGKTKCAKTPSSKHMPHGQNNFSLHFSQYFFPIVWQDCWLTQGDCSDSLFAILKKAKIRIAGMGIQRQILSTRKKKSTPDHSAVSQKRTQHTF